MTQKTAFVACVSTALLVGIPSGILLENSVYWIGFSIMAGGPGSFWLFKKFGLFEKNEDPVNP
jgi:hypothetical protein